MRILIVRLSSLGDIIHALPVAAAVRRTFPEAQIDWVVDERYRDILDLVPVIDRAIVLRRRAVSSLGAIRSLVREVRQGRYDVAMDVQGLVKSAVVARLSGAPRIIGFSKAHLREPPAALFYTEKRDPTGARHVVDRNLSLAVALGARQARWEFPIDVAQSDAAARVRHMLGLGSTGRFAIVNPGANWPNKRWPPERFGVLASALHRRHALPSAVLWGPAEEALARAVVESSEGAAAMMPETTVREVVAVAHAAALVVSGDTGPLHIAAALGTPVVGIYGPTDPARNGPWSTADVVVSRYDACGCPFRRSCHRRDWCFADIMPDEVVSAVERRLGC